MRAHRSLTMTLGLSVLLLIAVACAQAPLAPTTVAQAPPRKAPEVPYVPTKEPVLDEMLRMAQVKSGDVLYDLGCGDGRIVIAAAQRFGIRGVGVDIDPERITVRRKVICSTTPWTPPARITSSPEPPDRRSSPPWPDTQSSPGPELIRSAPDMPRIRSGPSVP